MEVGNFDKDMTGWFDFGDDAAIELVFIPKDEANKIVKRNTRTEFKRGQPRDITDDDKANIELGRKVVRGWRGLTKDGVEFPYSEKNGDELMRKSYAFSNFVNERCVEIDDFTQKRDEAAVKKSGPMPSGGQKA